MQPKKTMIQLSKSLELLFESYCSYYFLQYTMIRYNLLRKLANKGYLSTSLNIFLNKTYDTSKHTLRIFIVRLSMLIVMLGRFIDFGSSSSSKSYDSQTWMKYEINEGIMNYIVLMSSGLIFRQLYTENSLSLDMSESIESFLKFFIKCT